MAKKIKATVFIPTYNGEKYLPDILNAIYEQKVDFEYEVLVIDSGSTDSTLSIIKNFPDVKLHKISNSEYGHGKTRQQAAKMATGEVVVYLSHDAVPSHDRWLYEIVRPFDINKNIVGVMGKQIPRQRCFPLLKYEIQHVFRNFGPDFGTTIFYKDDFIKEQAVYDAVGFYSDANSAARKSFLLGDVPYKDVDYAEDQIFGRDIIEKGYLKAYAARGSVFHSNDLRLREYKNRMFDETLGLKKAGIPMEPISFLSSVKLTVKGIVGDSLRIMRDREYSFKRKAYWLVVNPFFHIEKWRGVRKATQNVTEEDIEKLSLEQHRKKTITK